MKPKIKYKTEGKVQIDCPKNLADPVILTWIKDEEQALLMTGKHTIELSQAQLRQLGLLAKEVADYDLGPDYSQRVEVAI